MKFKKKTIEKCSHEANNLGKNLLEKMKFKNKTMETCSLK